MSRMLRILLSASLLATLGTAVPRVAAACEDEERPVPCRLSKECAGADRALCAAVAQAFCGEKQDRCEDPDTLTMDPRYCAMLGQRIELSRRKARSPGAASGGASPAARDRR